MTNTQTTPTEECKKDPIQTLEWYEHIRLRPEMYLVRLGDGSDSEDGIYRLFKEIADNSVREFSADFGNDIVITIDDKSASIRDFGLGMALESIIKATSGFNSSGMSDGSYCRKSGGTKGLGTKVVNALSSDFFVCSYQAGERSWARYSKGQLIESGREASNDNTGTFVSFTPDASIFTDYSFRMEIVQEIIRKYVQENRGLSISLNGISYIG